MPRTVTFTRRVAAIVAAVVGCSLLAPATPAEAAGVTTHAWMAVDAIDLVADPDLQALLDGHREQVRAGAMFPDAGYIAGNTFGEEAHWQRFIDAYIAQIHARTDCPDLRDPDGPCADMIAHVMGMAGHGMGDEVWDWLFEPYGPDLDEYWTDPAVPLANEGGAEFQMDIVAVGVHGAPRPAIPPLPSTDALLEAFEQAGLTTVTASQFNLVGLGELVWDLERGWADTYLDDIQAAMPWMSANMVTAPGGVEFASTTIAGYWSSLWGRILGDQPPTSVANTYPAPGQIDVPATGWERTFQPGSARGRGGARNRITAALTYSRPYRPGSGGSPVPQQFAAGSMTLTERETGALVPIMAGYPQSVPYTADPGEHLIDVQPAENLEPCTWYDVKVSMSEPLIDAMGEAVTPYTWAFRTDDGAGATCPTSTSPLAGTVTGSDQAPLAGALVLAYAPTDGFWPSAIATTRADGSYLLTDLDPGSYRVLFAPPTGSGLAPEWSGDVADRAHAIELTVPTTSNADAELAESAQISGVVRDPAGSGLAEVEVLAFGASDTWVPTKSVSTAADGSYSLTSLPPGTYRLAFRPPAGSGLPAQWFNGVATHAQATPLVATPGMVVTADLQFTSAATVSGVVTGPAGAVPGVRVTFCGPSDLWVCTFEAITDANGAYHLDHAPPGTYQVRFGPPATTGLAVQWFGGTPLRGLSDPVELATGTSTDVSAILAPAG